MTQALDRRSTQTGMLRLDRTASPLQLTVTACLTLGPLALWHLTPLTTQVRVRSPREFLRAGGHRSRVGESASLECAQESRSMQGTQAG